MKNLEILNRIENKLNDDHHSFLSYNSLVEEALKLSILAKNNSKPIVVIKENNYLVNRLKEILDSYFSPEEILTYLPEESLRAEEIASSFEKLSSSKALLTVSGAGFFATFTFSPIATLTYSLK